MGLEVTTLQLIDKAIADAFGSRTIQMLELGNQLLPPKSIIKTGKEYFSNKGHLHVSVDINGENGAVVKDLREPLQFAEWYNRFDVVTNSGTSEHVEPFSKQYECFEIIHNCLKPGGIVIHVLPDVDALDTAGLWANHCAFYYSSKSFEQLVPYGYEILSDDLINGLRTVVMKKVTYGAFAIPREQFLSNIHDRTAHNEGLLTLRVVKPNTMVGRGRIRSLSESLEELVANKVAGDFVECGTWRGGLSALMLSKIVKYKLDKQLWVYDTFQGMTTPGEQDVSFENESALDEFKQKQIGDSDFSNWCRADKSIVENTLSLVTEEWTKHCILVEGKVEETLIFDYNTPKQIAMLRLDTDWYDSTRCEFEILFPKVAVGGIIIVDDYSCWQGSRKATDEYLSKLDPSAVSYSVVDEGALLIKKLKG